MGYLLLNDTQNPPSACRQTGNSLLLTTYSKLLSPPVLPATSKNLGGFLKDASINSKSYTNGFYWSSMEGFPYLSICYPMWGGSIVFIPGEITIFGVGHFTRWSILEGIE